MSTIEYLHKFTPGNTLRFTGNGSGRNATKVQAGPGGVVVDLVGQLCTVLSTDGTTATVRLEEENGLEIVVLQDDQDFLLVEVVDAVELLTALSKVLQDGDVTITSLEIAISNGRESQVVPLATTLLENGRLGFRDGLLAFRTLLDTVVALKGKQQREE